MNSENKKVILIGIVVISSFAFIPMAIAQEVPAHVVISEIQIDGTGEWMELYNPTDSDINVSSWYWCYFSQGRNWNNSYKSKAFLDCSGDLIIEPHTFYLMRTDGIVSGADWNTTYTGDPDTLSNIAGSVGIFPWNQNDKTAEEAKNGRIDAVGWDGVEYVNETQSTPVPGSGKSIERKSLSAGYAPCQDTDNNSFDFSIKDTPTPMNSSSPKMDPVPTPIPVPEYNFFGVLALISILSAVLAVATSRRREENN